ncbi:cysteine-rich receptor-like protein kinase 10 [Lycium barbarum]|uniref:cysteine-rich receptor-like protein kinase 10 n=1 Tax=Lycium barbarum TaxID=112863 RepID=UPI00293EB4D4|nr:cysteine-rich receptor-like protein kinase 10 [Lycium barbarum]
MTMVIQKWLLFLFLHIHLHDLILAELPGLIYYKCGVEGNYTKNSVYQKNLNSLLSSLSSNMDKYGFYNASIGQNSDMANAIVLCRGDLEVQECRNCVPNLAVQECRNCVQNLAQKLVQKCPNQTEAFGGYDGCMLWYSNLSILDARSNSTLYYMCSQWNASKPEDYNQEVYRFLGTLQSRIANGGSLLKYATGNVTVPEFQTVYALAQCIPDLVPQNCFDCLTDAYELISFCNGKMGGRIVLLNCNFRYESYSFFKDVALEAPPPAGNDNKTPLTRNDNKTAPIGNDDTIVKDDKTARSHITIIVPIVTIVILTVCIFVILMKKRKRKLTDKIQGTLGDDISKVESLQYDFSTIRAATNNFSNANKLGQGGFGPVYKGELPNGQEVAVKRLSADSGQGDLEFKNEVLLVARLQHRSLVRLLGFCLDGIERLLVYEFVPNASLDHFLFDRVKRGQLDWERRSKIIGGIARGILYLHEDSRFRIIHRDLKASNVLLDAELNPKIADFGMARLVTVDETQGNTKRIVGTYGYMAPEYAMHGQFSVKSDVFSFGVLILEIVSGESVKDLLSHVWSNWHEGTTSNLIDPMLTGSSGLVRDVIRYIHIALLCVQEDVANRPTMGAVVLMLNSHSLSLPLLQESNSRMSKSSKLAKSESICLSRNEASITELYPR